MRIAWRLGNMIGYDHVWIANFLVGLDRLDEIDIAFVREGFYKIIGVPANITKVNIKYLASGAEVTNYVKDFYCWSFQHL